MGSSGCLVHAVMPAMASEALMSLRKPRRETASAHSDAPRGNSRCIFSWNSGSPASSSRLLQYCGPAVCLGRRPRFARSSWTSLSFLPGQTSSRSVWSFCCRIFIRSFRTSLTVARGAAGDVGHGSQPVFFHQVGPQRLLIGIFLSVDGDGRSAGGLLVLHVENLVARAQESFRLAVTAKTPLHLQRGVVEHQGHAVDRPVTGVAAHALGDMNAVIEIDEVREIVDPGPDQGFAAAEAFAHRLEQRRIDPDLAMAVHAGGGGGNPGEV